MGGDDLYDLLHTKSRDRDKEIIENRSDKLIGMNEEKCIKYLEQKIEWFFTIDYVISDSLYQNKPITINNRKYKFHKLKPSLLKFGIIKNRFKYSDLEKTILDLIYLGVYSSKPKVKILMEISDYTQNFSKSKIRKYVQNYPNSVKEIIGEII